MNDVRETAKELEVGEDLSTVEGRGFKKEPAINVITKEDFEERVRKVFNLLYNTLAKSFGPYGAVTLIYNYPYAHATKDGFTIAKNLSMDCSETITDQAIADMAINICGRLNFTVGDGTTSAIIATNSIFQNYMKNKDYFTSKLILPRDIMAKYEVIKEKVIENLKKKVTTVRTSDREQLSKNIHDVVYISSNGNDEITNYISDMYKEIGCPAITCQTSPDGVTRAETINGYQLKLNLIDRIYINNDDKTMDVKNADIVILSVKVTRDIYERILIPLNEVARSLGRNLIVAAPVYDENTINQRIKPDLVAEYKSQHKINMILTSYRAATSFDRQIIEDFAMLTNTTVIDGPLSRRICEAAGSQRIFEIFNIFDREIPGINTCIVGSAQVYAYPYDTGDSEKVLADHNDIAYQYMDTEDGTARFPYEKRIRLGFVKSASLGLNKSVFSDFKDSKTGFTIYDEETYEKVKSEAEEKLNSAIDKYKNLGTFNLEVGQCQERFYALDLKIGIIYVGGDSELSIALLKDAVDDAIKAASSAFYHGIINGCNVSLIQSISELEAEDETEQMLINILRDGFRDVYKTVLKNAFSTKYMDSNNIDAKTREFKENCDYIFGNTDEIFEDNDVLNEVLKDPHVKSVQDVIVEYSVKIGKVFDLSTKRFSTTVINSEQTDEEILKATIDLISLLIVGNQMVITQKHNF